MDQPVKKGRNRLLIVGICCVVGLAFTIALAIAISFKTFQYLYAKAPNPVFVYEMDKTVKASIPQLVPVEVRVSDTIPVKLSKVLRLEVPLRKDVDVWIDDDFTVPVHATFTIPFDQDVEVHTEVPIEMTLPLDGVNVHARLLGIKNISLPLSGTFPVKTVIPLRRPIHIKTQADVRVHEDVTVHVKKRLTLPLDLRMDVELPIDDVFDIRFLDDVAIQSRIPDKIPVEVHLKLAISKQGIMTTD